MFSVSEYSSLQQWWDMNKAQMKQLFLQYNLKDMTRSMGDLETDVTELQHLADSTGEHQLRTLWSTHTFRTLLRWMSHFFFSPEKRMMHSLQSDIRQLLHELFKAEFQEEQGLPQVHVEGNAEMEAQELLAAPIDGLPADFYDFLVCAG